MASKWEFFLNEMLDDAGQLLRNEIKILLDEAKNDSEVFLRRQGRKIEKYLNQLAAGKISKKQFEGYLADIKSLTAMHTLQLSLASRTRAQRLIQGITALLLKRLIALI
jgi:hypothetical protein